MNKKKMVFSLLSLILSFFLFIGASLAWFATSSQVNNDPIGLNVDPGYITSSEIMFYTYDNVYKSTSQSNQLLVYNSLSSQWIEPTYVDDDDQGYMFTGIMMKQYDPFIPENNIYNNIIMELHFTYDIDSDKTINLLSIVDSNIASESILNFSPLGNIYYYSQISYLQSLVTDSYSVRADGTNLYTSLSSDFEQRDIYDKLIYSKKSFYGDNDTYSNSIDFGNITLTAGINEVYIYFNFSYYEAKIIDVLSMENAGSTLDTLPAIRFFQDITIVIKEGGN